MFTKVYSGKAGKCCCGCSGRYWEEGDKMFSNMLAKVSRLPALKDEGSYVWGEVGERLYIAYRDKSAV